MVYRLFPRVFLSASEEDKEDESVHPMLKAKDTPSILKYHGYGCEQHIVITPDGYYLVLHRIVKHSPDSPVDDDGYVASRRRPVMNRGAPLLFLHGTFLSSEIWVSRPEGKRNLAIQLAEEGYDVWLVNRRGNKYSQKHVTYKPSDVQFWNFSMDETIFHDVLACTQCVLQATGYKSLSIIGLSQGTTEAIAALAISPKLAKRVNAVVALSATLKPKPFKNNILNSMAKWSPELFYLMFGRCSVIRSANFWLNMMAPKAARWTIDFVFSFLFGMGHPNIDVSEKNVIYRFYFSDAGSKQVVHWLQILNSNRFQMYSDFGMNSFQVVPEFPVRHVTTPIFIICGTKDTLIDLPFLMRHLPMARVLRIAGYEHMDPIWARDAEDKCFPQIMEFLRFHNTDAVPAFRKDSSLSLLAQ